MFKQKKIICFIPARKGSKRIKNKNIVNFLGKPLITWTIEAAKKSKYIDDIFVTTNDPKVIKLCSEIKIKSIIRPKELCGNIIMPDKAIKHAYDFVKKKYHYVVTLQPTSPLRNNKDIDKAIKDIIIQKGDSLISVFRSKSFLWKKKNKSKYFEPINYDYKNRPRSQDLNFYEENGAIQISKPSILKKTNNRLGGKICISIMSENNSIDIDDHSDFKKAEFFSKVK